MEEEWEEETTRGEKGARDRRRCACGKAGGGATSSTSWYGQRHTSSPTSANYITPTDIKSYLTINQKMKTYLRPNVVSQILPIYQRIVTPELLEKCKGDTQNSNESLHNVIWSELPKTKFFTLKRMEYSIYRSVVKFNHGTVALAKATGDASWTPSIQKDKKRRRKSVKTEEKKKEEKERKIRKIQEEEEKRAEEGETWRWHSACVEIQLCIFLVSSVIAGKTKPLNNDLTLWRHPSSEDPNTVR